MGKWGLLTHLGTLIRLKIHLGRVELLGWLGIGRWKTLILFLELIFKILDALQLFILLLLRIL